MKKAMMVVISSGIVTVLITVAIALGLATLFVGFGLLSSWGWGGVVESIVLTGNRGNVPMGNREILPALFCWGL